MPKKLLRDVKNATLRILNIEKNKVSHRSFSSHGEDQILRAIFNNHFRKHVIKNGFYVDVGAHHPTIASNSEYLYQLGWSGINIEANPYAIEAFNRERSRDININCAITNVDGEVEFFLFGDINTEYYGSSSTISPDFCELIQNDQNVNARSIKVPAKRLDTLLSEYADGKQIHFLNLDIEGHELIALQTNDWDKYRPLVMAIEILPKCKDFEEEFRTNDIIKYVYKHGYKLFSHTLYTWFFYDTLSSDKEVVECWMWTAVE